MLVSDIRATSILNPTSGFLADGFTHTINPYRGCALGNSLCGTFCYAQHNFFHTKGRRWGAFLDVKQGMAEAYRRDYARIRRSATPALHVYMSSVTEPYPPQELSTRRTRGLLEVMLDRPPDRLVVQSHTPLVRNDLDVLRALADRCVVQVNVTVETDRAEIPGLPRHAYPPALRIDALAAVRAGGVRAVGVVSPLLPLADPRGFAHALEAACDAVILDHYLIGDGSKNGLRTQRTGFPAVLAANGFAEWTRREKLDDIHAVFRSVFTEDTRILVSREGFNAEAR